MVLGCQNGRVSVVTPATLSPLVVREVASHLRIDHHAEDKLLADDIDAAVGELDSPTGWLGRSLAPRTLRLTLDAPPPRAVYLPGPPVSSIDTITYRDTSDALVVIYDSDVGSPVDTIGLQTDLTAEPALIWPDDDGWPSDIKGGPDSFRVEYVAGYTDAVIPKTIRQWLLMRIGDLYRGRETEVLTGSPKVTETSMRMLDNLRVRAP